MITTFDTTIKQEKRSTGLELSSHLTSRIPTGRQAVELSGVARFHGDTGILWDASRIISAVLRGMYTTVRVVGVPAAWFVGS